MYGPVYPGFYGNWLRFQSAVSQATRDAFGADAKPVPLLQVSMPYIDHADTHIVMKALNMCECQHDASVHIQGDDGPRECSACGKQPDGCREFTRGGWDYLLLLEHDNIAPNDWANVIVNELDPEVHHIVGRWYFGKAQEDMRSICGYLRPDGAFDRLSYDEVQNFRQHRGLYRVGTGMKGVDDSAETFVVGLGCTAIHRSVLENWDADSMPWFKNRTEWNAETKTIGMEGHDVRFCNLAAKQGFNVWIDTRKACGHIGEFISDDETYTLTADHMTATGKTTPEMLAGSPDPDKLGPSIPTAMAMTELNKLAELAVGKTVLEIGSRFGASTIGMAGMGAKIVYALDWHRGDRWHGERDGKTSSLEIFWRYVGNYGQRDRIVPLVGRSDQVLPILPAQYFDLILVDGDHSYEGVKFDLQHALRVLKPGGVIAVHDWEREKTLEPHAYPEGSDLELGVTKAARELLGEPDELVETIGIYHDPARRSVAA
jgi:predicted O-methyltransferase YrrM